MLCRSGLAVALLLSAAAAAPTLSIQIDAGAFKVAGWEAPRTPPSRGWASLFVVYAGEGKVPALLGSYGVESATLVFHPRYPLAPGVRYRAVFHPPGGAAAIERIFEGPPRDITPRTRVECVYPSAEVWPANQLRLYIYFSAPMSRGEAARRIRLVDAGGRDVKGVFLPGEELWDPRYQRLTMTFDPGRIKRGLTSNVAMGAPLAEGKRYRLLIDREWPDARGVPMLEGFSKSFRGGPLDRRPPDPREWRITPPPAGSRGPLVVEFPKPMNYPLLQRMLTVSRSGRRVEGTSDVDRQETRWRFTPGLPWPRGEYQLVVDTGIEDLAGNHVGQPFDIDVFERVTERISRRSLSLPFQVR